MQRKSNRRRDICICCCSVTQSCLTLCDPVDCSTPGLPVHHQLQELTQTHVHWVGDAIQLSHPLTCPSPAFTGSFPMNQFVTSSGQSIVVSASASVLPMNIQGWFPLGLTGFISLQSKGLKSSAAQFESINYSALNLPYGQLSHSHTTTRETITDYMDLCQQSDVPAF